MTLAMPGPFALDFFTLAFLVSLGTLQMAAAYRSLRGLLFVRSRAAAFLLGLAVMSAAFIWFYLAEPRNVSDIEGGIDGNQSSALFAGGAAAAVLTTLLLSSLLNWSFGRNERARNEVSYRPGLDALEQTNYVRAFKATVRSLWGRS